MGSLTLSFIFRSLDNFICGRIVFGEPDVKRGIKRELLDERRVLSFVSYSLAFCEHVTPTSPHGKTQGTLAP